MSSVSKLRFCTHRVLEGTFIVRTFLFASLQVLKMSSLVFSIGDAIDPTQVSTHATCSSAMRVEPQSSPAEADEETATEPTDVFVGGAGVLNFI